MDEINSNYSVVLENLDIKSKLIFYSNHSNVTTSFGEECEGKLQNLTTNKDDTLLEWERIDKIIQERNQSFLYCQEENEAEVW